jgi:hypothetical protein
VDRKKNIGTRIGGSRSSRANFVHPEREASISGCRRSKLRNKLLRANSQFARSTWGFLAPNVRKNLETLTESYGLSIVAGDLQLLDGKWYVTHSGLLGIARRRHCAGIRTDLVRDFSDSSLNHWVFKATVYKAAGSRGFAGYGDADPSNTSPLVRGAELRVAETRAVNRALRKAYGIGLCSVEELGSFSGSKSFPAPPHSNGHHSSNGSSNGPPRLRDRLCLLIRQYNLDPTLVKAYAADFCGTATLKEAGRDLVESFISELGTAAKNDRDALLCKLNSYVQTTEVKL